MADNQKRWFCDIKFEGDVQFLKAPTGLTASAVTVDVTNFGAVLSSSEDTLQKVADKLDDHTHTYAIPYYRIGDIFETTIPVDPGETLENGGLGYGTWQLVDTFKWVRTA